MADKLMCNLDHPKPVAAALKLEIKSTRVGKPGHPMVRTIAVCKSHAQTLRKAGVEIVHA